MQILTDSWLSLHPRRHPYRWLATSPGTFLSLCNAGQLADTFPKEGFVRRNESERAVGKRYSNFSRTLSRLEPEGALASEWRSLIDDLLDSDYRDHVARILGQQRAAEIELRLVCHGSGDWLGPHTDREDKLFSHIVYFNRGWSVLWGGCLQILCDNDAKSIAATVSPELGASVLLERADNSWHQVTEVSPEAHCQRRSLVIHGLR